MVGERRNWCDCARRSVLQLTIATTSTAIGACGCGVLIGTAAFSEAFDHATRGELDLAVKACVASGIVMVATSCLALAGLFYARPLTLASWLFVPSALVELTTAVFLATRADVLAHDAVDLAHIEGPATTPTSAAKLAKFDRYSPRLGAVLIALSLLADTLRHRAIVALRDGAHRADGVAHRTAAKALKTADGATLVSL